MRETILEPDLPIIDPHHHLWDWTSRLPFLPLPDPGYLRWRMLTAYADEAAVPPVDDVVRFARWRRETRGL